jgi:ABC-2 type transport system permease protein
MKAWTIAWKDVLIRLRDRNALMLMLFAPLVISGLMGAALASGASESSGGLGSAAPPGQAIAAGQSAPVKDDQGRAIVAVKQISVAVQGNSNPFAFFAPSMAIFFLMISMFEAPRSILIEKEEGTLGRLIRTPTGTAEILAGKMGGAFITGIVQFALLVAVSSLIFRLQWSSSISALLLMVCAVVVAAGSLGALIAAFSRDLLQAGAIGGAVALVSAGLGGNFFDLGHAPLWLQFVSRLTINRWALEGFTNLTVRGLGLSSVLPNIAVLFTIALVMFSAAFWKFQRRITA